MNEHEQLIPETFDYNVLTPEQVQRTRDVEIRIIGRTQRTIIENGRDLLAVKADIGHGNFIKWVQSLGISERTAFNWMAVAQHFGENCNSCSFETTALYLLSTRSVPESAREEVRQRAEAGEKITEELARQIRDAHRAREQAEREKQAVQQELLNVQQSASEKVASLDATIARLQQQLEAASEPEIRVEVREKEVVPPAIEKQLQQLKQQIATLTQQRDNLAKESRALGEQIRNSYLEQQVASSAGQTIRWQWRNAASTFHKNLQQIISQLPTSFETKEFEAQDWEHLNQIKDDAQRIVEMCERLHYHTPATIIDALPL